ncbi:MAG: hypothetical protein N4A76_01255 [Firmicutes bacterium]|nr:hypothetical protein [Bacillota bacterium]
MNIFPKIIKNQLNTCIKNLSDRKENYVMRPGKDFTRKRCLPFEKVIQFLITMSDGSLAKELLEFFNLDVKTPTTSSLIQQRNKIKPEALLHLLHDFVGTYKNIKTYKGYRLLAIDGSNINIPTNPNDTETYAVGTKNSRGYNILHINAIYDL